MISDCPFCGKASKLYVNTESGMWDCKHGTCGQAGNLWKLATQLGVRVREKRMVRGLGEILMEGLGATDEPHKGEPVRNARGQSLDLVRRQCERLFVEDYKAGAEVLAYLRERGFDDETIKHFNLGVGFMPKTKELAVAIPFVDQGKVPLVKFRRLANKKPKYMRTKGSGSPLFNADAVRDRKQVILVEGELDAVSLWQLGITNVASTSLGVKDDFPQEWKEILADVDDIVLWYDADDAGEGATQELATRLGSYRCRIASMDDCPGQEKLLGQLKDANDLLKAIGIDEETTQEVVEGWARTVIDKAAGIRNTTVVQPSAFIDVVMAEVEKGKESLGIPCVQPSMRKLIGGWRQGELTIVTGHTSHGKSTWLTAEGDGLAERGVPVLMSAFEGGPASLVRKIFQRKFGQPISSVDSDAKRDRAYGVASRINENPIYLIDAYGRTPLDTIVDAIRYAVSRLGVRFVMLDHLHYFLERKRGQDEREAIDDVGMQLTDLCVELNIHIWLVCHPRGGIDETTIPTGDSLKGASSLKQNAFNGISVFRSKGLDGDPRPRKVKLRDGQNKRVEIELGYLNSLVYVWKARHESAFEGATVLDFSPRNLSFADQPKARSDDEPEQEDGPASDVDPDDNIWDDPQNDLPF